MAKEETRQDGMIPDFQSVMLPFLKMFADGKEHKLSELNEKLAEHFNLTEEARRELLPKARYPVFHNRLAWAGTFLTKAGLVDRIARGTYKITERGMEVVRQNPSKIDIEFLKQFPEFAQFQAAQREKLNKSKESIETIASTPDEVIEDAYQRIRESLSDELLARVMELSPAFFERLVIELLVKMGYGGSIAEAGRAIGRSGDEGIDGTIKEDKLGLDIIYIQAKRWQAGNTVGRPEIQKFVGALAGKGAKKGIFITTSAFTKDAAEYVKPLDAKVILIGGEQLANYMIDYDIGVSCASAYEIKKVDIDYFSEDELIS